MKRLMLILIVMLPIAAFCQTTQPTVDSVHEHCTRVLWSAPLDPAILSAKDRSDLELCRTMRSLQSERAILDGPYVQHHAEAMRLWKLLQTESRQMWYDLQEVYCRFNPSAVYIDPLNHLGTCDSKVNPFADNSTLPKLFQQSETLASNVDTFEQGLVLVNGVK